MDLVSCTALGQCLGRSPYSPTSFVAMRLQGNHYRLMSTCALVHKVDSSREKHRFSLRYPAGWRSKQSRSEAVLSTHLLEYSCRYARTRRHTRQQHQPNTRPIAISASSALTRSIVAPLACDRSIDRGESVFLTVGHKLNTQQRRARSKNCAAAKLGGSHARSTRSPRSRTHFRSDVGHGGDGRHCVVRRGLSGHSLDLAVTPL